MILFALTTAFCLLWRIKETDGRPAKDGALTFINRENKQNQYLLTSRHVETPDVYIHSYFQFKMWDDISRLSPNNHKSKVNRLHNTRNEVDNSQSSLARNSKNKQWNQLILTVRKNTFMKNQVLNVIPGTANVPYHRDRRDTNSARSNGSVAVPNVNSVTHQLDGDIHANNDNEAAQSNSGSSLSTNVDNVDISGMVDPHTIGNSPTGTPVELVQSHEETLNGQRQQHGIGSINESSRLQQVNHDNIVGNSDTDVSVDQQPAPGGDASDTHPGDTPVETTQSGVLDQPSDVGHEINPVVEPAGDVISANSTQERDHFNANAGSSDRNSYRTTTTSNEELSFNDSTQVSGSSSNPIAVNGDRTHLNSNVSSPSGALPPAVINDNKQINQHPHTSNEQDNDTESGKSRSDQNASAAIHPTNSIPSFVATSIPTAIISSLQPFYSSLIDTRNELPSVATREIVPTLQSGHISGSEFTLHSITPSAFIHEDVFSIATRMLTVSHISSTFTRDLAPSSMIVPENEVAEQTLFIQPTTVVLSTPSTQAYTAPGTSSQSGAPSTSRPHSDVGIPDRDQIETESNTIEPLQTSSQNRITASTAGHYSPSQIIPMLIPEIQNNDLTSSPTHSHFMTHSSSSTLTLSTSPPSSSAVPVAGRTSSRDTPPVLVAYRNSTATSLARPTGNPPPVRGQIPDAPELVHPATIEAQTTEPTRRHPNTEDSQTEERTTPTGSTVSQESTEHTDYHHNEGTSGYITINATVKPTSSGTQTTNETDSPTSYMKLRFGMSWPYFCQEEMTIRQELVDILQVHANSVGIAPDQIQVMDRETFDCDEGGLADLAEIEVRIYLTNISHQFDRNLTMRCATILKAEIPFEDVKNSIIKARLLQINIVDKGRGEGAETTSVDSPGIDDESTDASTDHRVTVAVVLAIVGGCCCVGLIILQVVVRRRHKVTTPLPSINSTYTHRNSDSMQLASVIKSRPNSGLINPGLDILEPLDPTHPLNYMQLSNFCMDENKITEEYQKLPQRMPRPSMVPAGEEDKNRYANILPLVHTRVKLVQDGPGPRSSYINANYVTGPNNQCQYYIATQAPTENTTADFWTMVWQQECRTIVMLTDKEEQGQTKCVSYWPELVGKSAAQKYGDFLIELLQKDVHQEYIVSRLEINNLRKIETRHIDHFWYTCWPPHGLPEAISLVKLVLDVRPKYEHGSSPLVVHCSPGTGRTCTFIALDLCMQQFETRRIVDIMKTVNSIRQERAGAIQNKEQYALLYSAVHEYATIMMTPGVSATSSVATLQALLSS